MIASLLDNDYYQFTMAHAIWQHSKHQWQVKYEFRNRTFSVPLANRIDLDRLEKEIDSLRQARFTQPELNYLRGLGLFHPGFLEYLSTVELPPVEVGQDGGHLTMTYQGDWGSAILWETPLLALVNHLYYERFGPLGTSEGLLRLMEKIEYLQERKTIKFIEFGTRRRYSFEWQHFVLHTLLDECPELVLGTSNVALAREFGIKPTGTMAHQPFMVQTAAEASITGIDPILTGTNEVLRMWIETYGKHPEMMTGLPDTFTTGEFIKRADPALTKKFTGWRQDSGDPIRIGHLLTNYANKLGVRPKIIFSDSLDVRKMSVIEDNFAGVETLFGWGTNLTNDLGFEPLSIVIKPCAVRPTAASKWLPCVKVSDDIAKATGEPHEIQRYLGSWWGIEAK